MFWHCSGVNAKMRMLEGCFNWIFAMIITILRQWKYSLLHDTRFPVHIWIALDLLRNTQIRWQTINISSESNLSIQGRIYDIGAHKPISYGIFYRDFCSKTWWHFTCVCFPYFEIYPLRTTSSKKYAINIIMSLRTGTNQCRCSQIELRFALRAA